MFNFKYKLCLINVFLSLKSTFGQILKLKKQSLMIYKKTTNSEIKSYITIVYLF